MRMKKRTEERERQFDDFVVTRGAALRRTAFLLCGDWHDAEDLVQSTLATLYATWHTIREPQAANAFARRILVRTFVDGKRRRWSGEQASDAVLDVAAARPGDVDTRLTLLDALERMSPTYRAVLVLRFWEDQSVAQTAALLDKRPNAVRSATTRGLEQLRAILGDQVAELAQA